MDTFKSFHRRTKGLTSEPKTVYMFYREGFRQPIKIKGQLITTSAKSESQAIRFFKYRYPEFINVSIVAKNANEYNAPIIPPKTEPKKPEPPEQLELNI